MKITKAVIPAAGFGTRFLPATKAVPKEMLPIIDKPTIQYIAEEAINAGITDLLLIVSRGKDAIVNHFDKAFELIHGNLILLLPKFSQYNNKTYMLKAENKHLLHVYIRLVDPLHILYAGNNLNQPSLNCSP